MLLLTNGSHYIREDDLSHNGRQMEEFISTHSLPPK